LQSAVKRAPEGDVPSELMEGRKAAKQSEIKTISLIRLALWDRARWRGVATLTTASNTSPPILGLVFENGEAATEIFQAWRQELGERDLEERLYIGIVRGVTVANPSAYRVVIGANPGVALGDPDVKFAQMIYRIQMMEPSSSANLDRFLEGYGRLGTYIVAPAVVIEGEDAPRVGLALGIEKKAIQVKQAWQVGRHDPEVVAIYEHDDLIMPPGVKDIPVREVLAWKRDRPDR